MSKEHGTVKQESGNHNSENENKADMRNLAGIGFDEHEVALADVAQDDQFGRHATKEGLQSLASSIKQHGLLNNPKLHSIGQNRYGIVTGRRRIAAAKLAGLTTIHADVAPRQLTDEDVLRLDLEDNRQREDLHCIDESIQIARYVDIRAGLSSYYPDMDNPLARVRIVLAMAKHPNFQHEIVQKKQPAEPHSKRGRPPRVFSEDDLDRYRRVVSALREVLQSGMTPVSWLEHYLVPTFTLGEVDRRRAVEYALSPTEVECLPQRLRKCDKLGAPQKLSAKRWVALSTDKGWIVTDKGREKKKKEKASGDAIGDPKHQPDESAARKDTGCVGHSDLAHTPTPESTAIAAGHIALPVDLTNAELQRFARELASALYELKADEGRVFMFAGMIHASFCEQMPQSESETSTSKQPEGSQKNATAPQPEVTEDDESMSTEGKPPITASDSDGQASKSNSVSAARKTSESGSGSEFMA